MLFYINISVMLNDDETLFHLYFDILFSQKLFETYRHLHLIDFLCKITFVNLI